MYSLWAVDAALLAASVSFITPHICLLFSYSL
jgi:hypothetical protein